jgi:type IV pilus assembly protein PilE
VKNRIDLHNASSTFGFSLLEILITAAIVSLVAGFCLPIYSEHLIHARRLEAQTALIQLAAKLEEYHILHHTYRHASLKNLGFSSLPAQKHYKINIASATNTQFLLMAAPLHGQTRQDKLCGTFTLNETGEKKFTGHGQKPDCWGLAP